MQLQFWIQKIGSWLAYMILKDKILSLFSLSDETLRTGLGSISPEFSPPSHNFDACGLVQRDDIV